MPELALSLELPIFELLIKQQIRAVLGDVCINYLFFPLPVSMHTATMTMIIIMIISSMTSGIIMAVIRSTLHGVSNGKLEAEGVGGVDGSMELVLGGEFITKQGAVEIVESVVAVLVVLGTKHCVLASVIVVVLANDIQYDQINSKLIQ